MDKLSRIRGSVRSRFTRNSEQVLDELNKEDHLMDRGTIHDRMVLLQSLCAKLKDLDWKMIEAMVDADKSTEEFEAEERRIDDYQQRWISLQRMADEVLVVREVKEKSREAISDSKMNRSPKYGKDPRNEEPSRTKYSFRLFVKQEDENEGQRAISLTGFSSSEKPLRNQTFKKQRERSDVPTAASLYSKTESSSCVFCGKNNHVSSDCYKAVKMSLDQKKQKIKENNRCYICLKKGHPARKCRSEVTCGKCGKRHLRILCNDQVGNGSNRPSQVQLETEGVHIMYAGQSIRRSRSSVILMKTLRVKVIGINEKFLDVRLLFDEGSQRSYIRKEVTEKLGCNLVKTLNLHSYLFGGQKTGVKTRKCFAVLLEGIGCDQRKQLELASEDLIRSGDPQIPQKPESIFGWTSCLVDFAVRSLSEKDDVYYWSEGTTVLAWIRRQEEWGTFVGRRVDAICRITSNFHWTQPGVMNPANLPSRGFSRKLRESHWWEGPQWLRNETLWHPEMLKPNTEEIRVERRNTSVEAAVVIMKSEEFRFSFLMKNVHVTGWIRRFTDKSWKPKKKQKSRQIKLKKKLIVAEKDLLKTIQRRYFKEKPELNKLFSMKKDGSVRVAKIKTRQGELIRPLRRLYLLEVTRGEDLEASKEVVEFAKKSLEEVAVNVSVKITLDGEGMKKPSRYGSWNHQCQVFD